MPSTLRTLTKAAAHSTALLNILREAHSAAINEGHNVLEVVLLAEIKAAVELHDRLHRLSDAVAQDTTKPQA